MARQEGVVKLKGQMGGLSFYKTKDGFLARLKGGVTGDRIKNDPAFERTRENGAEFGRAGAASKVLRTALRSLILHSADSRMASRLTRDMLKVIQADVTNPRGARNVIHGKVEMLQGFEFNQNAKLGNAIYVPYSPNIDRAAGSLWVDVPGFVPATGIAAPQGTTHIRFISAGVEVDFENGEYTVNFSQSEMIVQGPQNQPDLQLSNAVTAGSTKPLFLVFGIEFHQEVNGQWYPLKNGTYNALALVKIDPGA